ncbi:MAG: hypothetical protein QM755_12680 [Luteolibacter sp.]
MIPDLDDFSGSLFSPVKRFAGFIVALWVGASMGMICASMVHCLFFLLGGKGFALVDFSRLLECVMIGTWTAFPVFVGLLVAAFVGWRYAWVVYSAAALMILIVAVIMEPWSLVVAFPSAVMLGIGVWWCQKFHQNRWAAEMAALRIENETRRQALRSRGIAVFDPMPPDD